MEEHLKEKEKVVLISAMGNAPHKKYIQGTYSAANQNFSKWAKIISTN